MKRNLLLTALLCMIALGIQAQRSYTFNAVALNVDGLPPSITVNSIYTYNLNDKGPIATGTTTAMAQAIANQNWGIVGLSEDFNYHSDIESAVSPYYTLGTYKGTVATSYSIFSFEPNESDGLGLLCSKSYSFADETVVAWEKNDGSISEIIQNINNDGFDNGADELITKGFRCYTVTIDEVEGIKLDVYVLHMDAASRAEDIACREAQLTQLATSIKDRKSNGRHVLVIGDTNCRYTRENVKTGFIDVLDAAGFTCKDPWIELIRDGEYPTYGGDPIEYANDDPRDEVVDKIFYISNPTAVNNGITIKANSYHQETSINYSDHYPVVVNFTITNKNGTAADYELPATDETVETWTDANPTSPTASITGKQFYMRNVNSGLYFKAGSTWGSHFAEGIDGLPIQMTLVSGNTYKISTPTLGRYLGNNYFADNGNEAEGNWLVEEIKSTSNKGGSMTKYIFRNSANTGMAIASMSNGYHVDGATYNATDAKQQWVLYTYDEMIADIKEGMAATLTGATYNASGLITQPVCNLALDSRHASGWSFVPAIGGGGGGGSNESCVWEVFKDGASHAFDMNQTLSNLPNGTYTVKVQAFFRDGDANTSSTSVEPVLYAGSQSTKIHSILDGALASQPSWTNGHNGSKGWIPNDMWQANQWFKAGHYTVTLSNVTVSNGTLKIGIKNTSTATSMAWCCFDNFQLIYHGTAQGDLRTSALYKSIKAAADEAIATVENLNSDEATAAFDISNVAYRYNNNLISLDGTAELAMIDNAVKTAVKAQTAIGADMSLFITNNSFESGSTTGWSIVKNGSQTFVSNNHDATGMDGEYLFNTWAGGDYNCGQIYQKITGLRNGYYKLNALVASWADRDVYLVGNKQHAGVTTTSGEDAFVDHEVYFLVEDGTACIGAVGENENKKFYYEQGIFFKTDNFRLSYQGKVGEGRVKIALADAKAKAAGLNPTSKAQFDNAVAKYENATVTGDGKAEETAIYNALKEAIASQPYANTEMTWLITNPSFETGDWTGWTTTFGWDTRVAHATIDVAPDNGEGQYIMNTWNDWTDATNSGINAPVYQTLTNLPNGRYRLTADVTSDAGNPVAVYATVNGETVNDTIQPTYNWMFKTPKGVEFEVTGNADVTIGAVGYRDGAFNAEGGCWYKCDNFRLTYLGHEGEFNETTDNSGIDDWYTSVILNRTIKPGKWSTFVVPFDIPASSLSGWEVKELESSILSGDKITLVFADAADGIKAGVPYMVRNMTMGENLTQINMENIQVNTTLDTPSTSHVEFVGTYQRMNIPQGAFFISDNVFYQAADNTNTIKAFRAYFTTKSANARSLSYRFAGNGYDDDDETTAIDNGQLTNDNEVTTVAIYNERGMRLTEMQSGINILQMSDGSVVKVVIK